MHRFTHSYEALLSTHFNIILPTALRRRMGNKTTHLYSFFHVYAVLARVDYFRDIYYRNQDGFCFL